MHATMRTYFDPPLLLTTFMLSLLPRPDYNIHPQSPAIWIVSRDSDDMNVSRSVYISPAIRRGRADCIVCTIEYITSYPVEDL